MKKYILIIAVLMAVNLSFAQEEQEKTKTKDRPVREPFGSGLLIDNQTGLITLMEHLFDHHLYKHPAFIVGHSSNSDGIKRFEIYAKN